MLFRSKQMGLSSGINNLTLVVATFVTGWLASKNWHLPFLVYLIPIFAILLCYFLSTAYLKKNQVRYFSDGTGDEDNEVEVASIFVKPGTQVNKMMMFRLCLFYFTLTYIVVLVIYNLSFVMNKYGYSSTDAGTMISIFFLGMMFPGFFITTIVRHLKNSVNYLCCFGIAFGYLLIIYCHSFLLIAIACLLIGMGYGIMQPLVYDKTSLSASPKNAVFALACVMSMNYFAILVCPFIADLFQDIFHEKHNMSFPFWVNLIM